MNIERLTVEQASKELGISARDIRSLMRHGVLNIGFADKKEGAEKYTYIIFSKDVERVKAEKCIS